MAVNYLTTREAASLLGTSVRTVQQWVEKGMLEGWKTDGGHRRISRASAANILKTHEKDLQVEKWANALSVLIVEDDASLLKLYRTQLRTWPFEVKVYTAPNGYEALVLVGEVNPDMLICDLRLPGVNGFQIVRALCDITRFNHMGIVVVSGLPVPEINAHGGLPERVEIMGKPIDFSRLRNIAEKLWKAEDN